MFGKRIHLFTILGFRIRIDLSWIVIFVLVVWTLAQGTFPHHYENLPVATYWWMALAGALTLFASIIFHELSHSLVARRFAMPMRGITLFLFGGVAEMHDEPPSARAEFYMAIAGPLASVGVGLLALGLSNWGETLNWPVAVTGVLAYLGVINLLLAGFNLVPAFPLDGGRVLRSALWRWRRDIRWATRIASRIGAGFGIVLMVLGFASFLRGSFVGGLWWILIGLFLRQASLQSHRSLLIRQALQDETLQRHMRTDPQTVAPDLSVREFVDAYVYRHHFKMFPVVEDGRLVGCVSTRQLKEVPRESWDATGVRAIMEPCSPENSIEPQDSAVAALAKMRRTNRSRLMVTDGERLVGIVSLKDLLRFIAMKLELEEEEV